MLSYQHAYHAGNMADVVKHAALSFVLDYLVQKPKPLSYIETHAGRALYDLASPEAEKTGEAAQGIARALPRIAADHPYRRTIEAIRAEHGPMAYPGSPLVARHLLREDDRLTLCELHPQEAAALRAALPGVTVKQADGPATALSLAPPDPRRGLCLIDPSYEVKTEYEAMPKLIRDLHRKWNVGVLMLWYPVLRNGTHRAMTRALDGLGLPSLRHEAAFPPARDGHGMIGTGLYVVNPPWGLDAALSEIEGWIPGGKI